ncbi:SH3 domain-containing protein [Maribacter sp.]|nr:SH3 domain-containing protein [Maribacter sp.]
MKISKSLAFLLLVVISATTFSQEAYTVTAKSGLTIRNEPNPGGLKIGKLAYGMTVTVVEKTDFTLTITDDGKQLRGNWVRVTFENSPEFTSQASFGFVFDGFLEKVASNTTAQATLSTKEIELYKLASAEHTPHGKVGFVSLTDGYAFKDDDNALVIAREHLGEQEFNDDNYHVLTDNHRSTFLKSLGIRETDSIFIYHFSSDAIYSSKIAALPVVALLNPYGSEVPISQHDYMVGFEIGETILCVDDLKNYYSNSLVAIGQQNPFEKGQLRPVLWEKVAAKRFPMPQKIVADSTANKENILNETYEFTTSDMRYFLQNHITKGSVTARHFKVVALESDTLLFEYKYNPGEGAGLLALNTVDNKKQNNQIAIWTGRLFKNKPPIITDFISHSFGCPVIYFLKQTEQPIYIRCDNRH